MRRFSETLQLGSHSSGKFDVAMNAQSGGMIAFGIFAGQSRLFLTCCRLMLGSETIVSIA